MLQSLEAEYVQWQRIGTSPGRVVAQISKVTRARRPLRCTLQEETLVRRQRGSPPLRGHGRLVPIWASASGHYAIGGCIREEAFARWRYGHVSD